MRSVRNALIATGVACALVLSFAGVAAAQQEDDYTAEIAVACNTTTGDYDVTTTFTNLDSEFDLPFANVGVWYINAEEDWAESGLANFEVDTGTAFDLVVSIPGDSVAVELWWDTEAFGDDDVEAEMDGDCVAVATTTAAPTTTTAAGTGAAAGAAVVVTPAYTG